jgi:Uma2 family endonuclease
MAITSVALADIEPGQVVQTDLTLEDFLDLDPDALEPPYFEYEGDGLIRRKMSPNTDHAAIAFGLSHLFGAYRDRTGRSLYGYVELRTNVGDRSRLPDVAIYVGSRPAENERQQALVIATLSVEIRSPRQSLLEQRAKCQWYLDRGGTFAMLADPADRSTIVFSKVGADAARTAEKRYDWQASDALIIEFAEVFPGLDLTAAHIFAELAR